MAISSTGKGMRIGAVVLAGGKASRMNGADKGLLTLHGRSFLDRILDQLRDFPEILLAVDSPDRYAECPYPRIVDSVSGQGPMQGLAQALAECRSDALLAVAVDMPLFDKGLAEYLSAFFYPGCGAVAALDREGRRHPLCAVYAKRAAPIMRELLDEGERRLHSALALLDVRDAPLAHSMYPDAMLANINTAADLDNVVGLTGLDGASLCATGAGGPPVLAVCGIKDSGKTTLLRRVIPLLRDRGLRVGVIKHDGHDFVPDVPGTDSFLLREAGAERVAVYSAHRFMLTGEGEGASLAALLPRFRELDLVLVEGGKQSALPKIEIVRAHQGGKTAAAPEGLLAVCSDVESLSGLPPHLVSSLPRFALEDYEGLAGFILAHVGKGGADA